MLPSTSWGSWLGMVGMVGIKISYEILWNHIIFLSSMIIYCCNRYLSDLYIHCMSLSLSILYIYIHIYIYNTHILIYIYIYIYVHNIYIYMYIIYIYIYVHNIYIYIYVYVYVYVYVHRLWYFVTWGSAVDGHSHLQRSGECREGCEDVAPRTIMMKHDKQMSFVYICQVNNGSYIVMNNKEVNHPTTCPVLLSQQTKKRRGK